MGPGFDRNAKTPESVFGNSKSGRHSAFARENPEQQPGAIYVPRPAKLPQSQNKNSGNIRTKRGIIV